ncbi:murein biosynthesis integral membrane protein MurJ [Jeotgalibacillus sp. S-D1]|uniref:murein biosynthesis integral membrane protein MurJ n=1 Tax=Jeotgalibacillus sp. S-D1 TaxID=2552189 RepID=UPI00105A882A|nr:murein biosynthesis integral membrane protein MurJ [Jeotgalibacillus sp. S-D1]TDL32608.1 murein biosynthesis integral membrane protein MurJ [Jeotgalibacillus sp. S-D1]
MKSKLGLASLLFIIASLFLKISGLLRDMVVAFYFGDSFEAGAYFAAFNIPNMVILFLNTGMKNALVPTYINAIEKNRGPYHLSQVMKGTLIVSVIFSVIGAALAPLYIPMLYPNFNEQATEIAVLIAIIFFASVVAVGMNSVLEAFFDANNRFAISVVSQIVVILSSIISAILFAESIGVYSLALGYAFGTVLSLLLKTLFFIQKGTYTLRGKFDWLEIKSFYIVFIPVAVTVMIGQINLTVDYVFAGRFQEGVITYINNAKNLVHFPQAIIGVTIGTIIFPLLSKAQSTKNNELFQTGIQRGLSTMCLVLFPSVAGMMWLMPNIIELVFQRGAFSASAAEATTIVAYYYVGSVLFFSLQTVLNKGFYAMQKGHLILTIGSFSVLLNILFNYILTEVMNSYNGIPLASSIMAFFYFAVSYFIFTRLIGGSGQKEMLAEIMKITAAVVVMVGVLYSIDFFTSTLPNLAEMIFVAIAGAIIYIAVIKLLNVKTFSFLLSNLRRK